MIHVGGRTVNVADILVVQHPRLIRKKIRPSIIGTRIVMTRTNHFLKMGSPYSAVCTTRVPKLSTTIVVVRIRATVRNGD